MADCPKCKLKIRGETGIRCEGVCGKVYHSVAKCSGIDEYSAKVIQQDNMVHVICADCLQYIRNVDMMLQQIEDGVKQGKNYLSEYKSDFKYLLNENKKEFKSLLDEIEKKYNERLKKIEHAQRLGEKNTEEAKKLYKELKEYASQNKNICEKMDQQSTEISNELKELKENGHQNKNICKKIEESNVTMCNELKEIGNQNKNLCEKIEENNKKICNEIKKVVNETREKPSTSSYAAAIRNNTAKPYIIKEMPLIIKPKEKQKIDKTKEDLKNKVDPTNFKITNIENRRNGTVVIQSENIDEREKIKKHCKQK